MAMVKLTATADAITFAVRVQPRAAHSRVAGELEGALKVRLTAPPVDGAANEELLRLLAQLFNVPHAAVDLISGATNKNKIVRVRGINQADAEDKICTALKGK